MFFGRLGRLERGHDCSKTTQDGAKTGQDAPKTPQDGAKTAQDSATTPQDGAKTLQDGAKTRQDGAKTPKDGAKTGQVGAKTLLVGQDAPSVAARGAQACSTKQAEEERWKGDKETNAREQREGKRNEKVPLDVFCSSALPVHC